jgi:hypothetical protein
LSASTSTSLAPLSVVFEGKGITFYTFRDRLCVIGAEYGRAIKYAGNGGGLNEQIAGEWSNEFKAGRHFDVLTGADLREFKALVALTGENPVSENARSLTILYEAGFDLVAIKTEKPLGRKLRALIVDEIMPRLRRGEPVLPVSAPPAPAQLGEWSPEAIALKGATLLDRLADRMSPAISDEARDVLRARAAHMLVGGRIAPLLPVLPPGRWRRPTEIAAELGRTAAAVGRAITALGFRGAEHAAHRKGVLDKKTNGEGQVECSLWDDHVFEAVKKYLDANPVTKTTRAA